MKLNINVLVWSGFAIFKADYTKRIQLLTCKTNFIWCQISFDNTGYKYVVKQIVERISIDLNNNCP